MIKYGRAPRVVLTRSLLTDGHFLRVAGAWKSIWTSLSGIFLITFCWVAADQGDMRGNDPAHICTRRRLTELSGIRTLTRR
jgi:hypothetical protein